MDDSVQRIQPVLCAWLLSCCRAALSCGDGDTVRVIVGVGVADKVGHAVTVLRGRYASMQLRVNVENFAANAAGTVPVSQLLDTSKVLSHHQHR